MWYTKEQYLLRCYDLVDNAFRLGERTDDVLGVDWASSFSRDFTVEQIQGTPLYEEIWNAIFESKKSLPVYCPSCYWSLREGHNECLHCGAKLWGK